MVIWIVHLLLSLIFIKPSGVLVPKGLLVYFVKQNTVYHSNIENSKSYSPYIGHVHGVFPLKNNILNKYRSVFPLNHGPYRYTIPKAWCIFSFHFRIRTCVMELKLPR